MAVNANGIFRGIIVLEVSLSVVFQNMVNKCSLGRQRVRPSDLV